MVPDKVHIHHVKLLMLNGKTTMSEAMSEICTVYEGEAVDIRNVQRWSQ